MYQGILVPLDGSDRAETVMPHVVALAGAFSSRLVLLQIVPPFELVRRDLLRGDLSAMQIDVVTDVAKNQVDAQHAAAQRYLGEQIEALRSQGIEAEYIVEEGEPAASIVRFAEAHGSDLIAMATHGRGGLSRMVLGSVADRVMRSAHIPVLLVRSLSQELDA